MVKKTSARVGTVEDGETAVPNNPAAAKACACGCGENVVRTFKQGHDQRLVSNLAVDLVEGTGTGLGIIPKKRANGDIQARIDEVTAYVTKQLSAPLAAKVHSAAMARWANYDKRINAQTGTQVDETATPAEPVSVEEPETNGHALGAKVRVKVGRYEYDGEITGMNQAGKVTAVSYTNKAGNVHTIQTPRAINLV